MSPPECNQMFLNGFHEFPKDIEIINENEGSKENSSMPSDHMKHISLFHERWFLEWALWAGGSDISLYCDHTYSE